MAYAAGAWTGTRVGSLSQAVNDMKNALPSLVGTGSAIRMAMISETGPGKYWQPCVVYDA